MKLGTTKTRLLVFGALVVFGVAWWSIRFGDVAAPGQADRGDNGLWMRRHWLHGGADADPAELATALNELGIGRIYPFLGPMNHNGWPGWRDDGVIRRYQPDQARSFLNEMAQVAPQIQVMPWTGGILDRDVHLQERGQREAFTEHMTRLTEMGSAGVHLNIEPLPSFEPGYLDLLRAVKAAIGDEKVLSVAAYPPTTILHPHPDVHWSLEFTREVCLVADELVFMGYDTGLRFPLVYETLMATWIEELAATLPPPEQGGCLWSMGLSAYEDDEPWHDPETETIESGIRGVHRGFAGQNIPENFTGISLYASWTVDRQEWETYERFWRGDSPTGTVVPDRRSSP